MTLQTEILSAETFDLLIQIFFLKSFNSVLTDIIFKEVCTFRLETLLHFKQILKLLQLAICVTFSSLDLDLVLDVRTPKTQFDSTKKDQCYWASVL